MRVSPVELCNAELAKRSGAARDQFLNEGLTFRQPDAYLAKADWVWGMPGHYRTFENETLLSAVIVCQQLTGPKVRTEPPTTTGAPQRPGNRLPPIIRTATLRIERGPLIDVGRQSCPRSLRLIGFVEVARPLKGGVIFYGPGFLTPLAEFDLPADGRRNVIETYPINWDTRGGLAASGRERPRSKSVQVRMNVVGSRKQVLERREESIVVTCQFRRMGR